jgi:isopentenyl-diphosphate delta-isomerase
VERVILVDRNDRETGVMGKLRAHREGVLHRAFSVFVLNSQGDLLVQKRSEYKYHTGGLWTNTCDGHPRPGETTAAAAHRRLAEEMGFDCALDEAFAFVYHADLGGGLIENEYDHVLIGTYDGEPAPNPDEIETTRWVAPDALDQDMRRFPERYAPWFRLAFDRFRQQVGPADLLEAET